MKLYKLWELSHLLDGRVLFNLQWRIYI